MNQVKAAFKKLTGKGLFNILGSNVVNKIAYLLCNVFLVRFLSKTAYGTFGYANNILNMFLLFSGLGLFVGVLQFCSEDRPEEEKLQYYKFGFTAGSLFNLILVAGMAIYVALGFSSVPGSGKYLLLMAGFPILDYIFNFLAVVLRTKLQNKAYGSLMNVNSLSYCTMAVIGAWLWGLNGVIAAKYLSFAVSILFGFYCNRDITGLACRAAWPQVGERRIFMRYSAICCVNNSISQLLYLLDTFLIGLIIKSSEAIADYKVASMVPAALVFIPSSIMVFVYPDYARHKDDLPWLKANMRKMFLYNGILNLAVGVILFFGAPLIYRGIFGAQYESSIPVFRVLMLGYVINAAFKIPAGNLLAMMRKVHYNLVVNLISGIANIVLDIFLITRFHSMGAALATLIVIVLSAVLGCFYLLVTLRQLKREEGETS